jgi:DNA-binding MarR family transcriptional regulator
MLPGVIRTATADLDLLSEQLAALISDLSRVARESVSVNRTRLAVLSSLHTRGPGRITDLARAEHITQPSMTALVSRLEQEGWVERRTEPADGRVVNVAITSEGVAVLEQAIAARNDALRARLARLAPAEHAALLAALPALDKVIDP